MLRKGKIRPEILRLGDISRWADAHLERAMETGNISRAIHAARLVEAMESRANAIAMGNVAPYKQSD